MKKIQISSSWFVDKAIPKILLFLVGFVIGAIRNVVVHAPFGSGMLVACSIGLVVAVLLPALFEIVD